MKKIAVLGFGVIGAGVCRLLTENNAALCKEAGCKAELAYICDLRDIPGNPYGNKHIKDFNIILNDPDVAVVVEVTGARRAAFELSKKALEAKKSVVTSNKEVVSEYGVELLQAARENGVSYLFEASVGGAIPLIRTLRTSLATDTVDGICGILNGTTNYILTNMKEYGKTYSEALSEAQRLGYAEPDPTADVEGLDACRKISVLSAFVGGGLIPPEKITTKGISGMPDRALPFAASLGGKIKLIACAERTEDGVSAWVRPCFVPFRNILHSVDGVNNGVMIKCRYASDILLYGRGAGSIPTASAIISDVSEALSGRAEELVWKRVENSPCMTKKRKAFVITKGAPDALSGYGVTGSTSDGEYGACIIDDARGIENASADIIAVYDVLE